MKKDSESLNKLIDAIKDSNSSDCRCDKDFKCKDWKENMGSEESKDNGWNFCPWCGGKVESLKEG